MPSAHPTPSLLIQTTYRIHPAVVDASKDISIRMAMDKKQREGNTFLLAAPDSSHPTTVHLTEGWKSQQAIEEHLANDSFQRVLAEAQQLRIESPSAIVYELGLRYALSSPA